MKFNKLLATLGIAVTLVTVVLSFVPAPPVTAYEQYIYVQPGRGVVGTEIRIEGDSFSPSVNNTTTYVKIYFPDKKTLVKTTAIDSWGEFETSFVVGETTTGRRQVWAHDQSASPPRWVSGTFIVEPEIKVTKSSGYVGDNVTVSGSGFAALSNTTIYFSGSEIAAVTTNSSGSFTKTDTYIPSSVNGTHIIKVVDATGNQSTAEFITKRRIIIGPTSGPTGRQVTINGTGFSGGQLITVSLDYKVVATSPSSIRTSPTGNFTGRFYILPYAVGTYTVEASDGGNKADTPLKVTFGGQLNRIVGYVGSDVTFTAAGFVPGRVANIHYDDAPLAEATVGTDGNISVSFKIPPSSAGNHTIFVTDGTNTTKHTFTVFSGASAEINRNFGYVGSDIIFSGAWFLAGRIITVYYDDIPIAEATVDGGGNFSASFTVPASSGGEHSISTTDGINTVNSTFVMESIPPPAPVLLLPIDDAEIEIEAGFAWEDTFDPSGVTYTLQIASEASFVSTNVTSLVLEKSGLAIARYLLAPEEELEPTEKGAAFYWRVRAIDGALNTGEWSAVRKFYISSSWAPWFLYSVIAEGGVFALLFGFWMVRRKR